eukprot:4061884-Prymnesium_polylepis.1
MWTSERKTETNRSAPSDHKRGHITFRGQRRARFRAPASSGERTADPSVWPCHTATHGPIDGRLDVVSTHAIMGQIRAPTPKHAPLPPPHHSPLLLALRRPPHNERQAADADKPVLDNPS